MSDEPKKQTRAWVPWSIAIGLFLLGLLMLLFGREGARSDRPDFYGSIDGVGFLLSPFVMLAGLLRFAILCVRAVSRR
jgi:hypothetical protein